jgi:MFS family permease
MSSPEIAPASSPSATPRPWWILPIFGRSPDLAPGHYRLLGFVSLALLFENYDFSLLTAALPYIAASLGLKEAQLGEFTSLIRLGALPAFLVVPLADRFGRRRVFLLAVVGLSVGTAATGLCQTALEFVLVQIVTRTCMLTAATLAFVIVAEELPAGHRGWGIGMLGALASLGHGLSALLFAAIEVMPFGWRALYLVGLLPVFWIGRFRAGVRETERFRSLDPQAVATGWLDPFRRLVSRFPARAAGVAVLAVAGSAAQGSVYQFTAQFLLVHRGWQPGQYSLLVLTAGILGVFGNVIAGRLGDRFGRRAIGCAFVGVFPVFAFSFVSAPGSWVILAWGFLVFSLTASTVTMRAFATELFPTSYRGTATGWVTGMETVGSASGLLLVSAAMRAGLELGSALALVSLLALIGAAVILTFPETGSRELESISE